jgi:hypothetical protein
MYKFFIATALLFCSCNNFSLKKKNLRGIKVSETVSILSPTAKLLGYDTFHVKLYYSGNAHLYQLNYQFDSLSNDVQVLSEIREHYVYYQPGNTYGYDFDVHKSPNIRKIPIDSLRKWEWVFQIDVYNIFTKAKATLVSSRKNVQRGTLKEHYNFEGIKDTSMTGSCYLTFTKNLKNIEYSLCRELDSAKKMKLQEIRIVNNARYFRSAGIYLEKSQSSYILEEVKNFDQKKIQSYFDMFNKKRL